VLKNGVTLKSELAFVQGHKKMAPFDRRYTTSYWSDMPKKLADEICKRHGEIEYRGGCKVLQRWRGLGDNVRLSHLLMSF